MLSRRLLLLGGLAILAVVCNHAAQWGTISMFWWTDRYLPTLLPIDYQMNTLSYFALSVIRKLAVFSVPAFLFISGYFVAYAARGTSASLNWRTVKARLGYLLLPYLIWSCVVFLGDALEGDIHSALEYLRRLALGQAVGAYFYVIMLCQLYMLSPLLVAQAKSHWRRLLVVAATLQLGVICLEYVALYSDLTGVEPAALVLRNSIPTALFIRLFFFFVLGVVCGMHLQKFKTWLAHSRRSLLLVLVLSALLAIIEAEVAFRLTGSTEMAFHDSPYTIPSSVYAVAVIFCFLSSGNPPFRSQASLHQIGVRSYGIYLLHPVLLEFTARTAQKFIPWILAYQALFLPMLIIAGIAVPTLFMSAVAASPARKYYRYLFG